MATGMLKNDASGNCLQQQPPPGMPDSPDSIPLPESPPPESSEQRGELDARANPGGPGDANVVGVNPVYAPNFATNPSTNSSKRKGKGRKPRLAEEYDPSEPLTSSDEEEHSLQLIDGGRGKQATSPELKATRKEPNNGNSNLNKNIYTTSDGGGGSGNRKGSSNSSALESSSSSSPKTYSLSTTPPPSKSSASEAIVLSKYSVQEPRPPPHLSGGSYGNSVSNVSRVDLNSIPVPPEENRRPVIHFSIPTRHKLLPISSLIKRQKGAGKRDGGGGNGNGQQSDGKASERGQDGDDEDEEDELDDLSRPRISLVAEIFGNDDDDEENEEETEQQTMADNNKNKIVGGIDQPETDTRLLLNHTTFEGGMQQQPNPDKISDPNHGRWKLVADEPNANFNPPPATTTTDVVADKQAPMIPPPQVEPEEDKNTNATAASAPAAAVEEEDEPEIIEIVTLNVPPSNRLRPLRRRPYLGRLGLDNLSEPEVIDIDKIDDDEVSEVAQIVTAPPVPPPPTTHTPPPRQPSPPPPTPPPETHKEKEKENERDRGRMLRPVDSSPEQRRHFKRPHSSSSMSNCEEGEIVDQVNPSKRRKKDKRRKTKRRKRSKDSPSPPPKLPEKRLSDNVTPTAAPSDPEDHGNSGGRGAISWRKPSKRSQNRNYRDGKPKADDTFFREKEAEEKQGRSNSPRRGQPPTRKEKSPVRDKSGAKLRRDETPRSRSHSKSPAGRNLRSRSRSGGRPYRSRRRNRHSRSKSTNSLSDKSKSERSSSRRRPRRRYRSNSRHRAGDSRSPSYITEPIRSRSSHYSKLRDRSRSKVRDRHARGRHRKRTPSKSKSLSPASRSHKKNKKPESLDRQQRKKQLKNKEKQTDGTASDSKEKRKEKEKLKEKEKRKKKEKPKEEEKVKPKEKVKEKEKRKKRKRREKSPTPVKAIVADGDSIVVSLSFQKGKTATTPSTAQVNDTAEERNENSMGTSENSESNNNKQLNKLSIESAEGNNFNLEAERSNSSPAKLSSVTDEEGNKTPTDPCPPSDRSKPQEEKETEAVKVTSSGGGSCGSNSPFEGENSFSAAADSTKIVTPQPSEQHESSFNHSRSSMSPTGVESNAQGDSLVTSTDESIEPAAAGDDESSKSNPSSIPSKQAEGGKLFPSLSHKISTSAVSPRFQPTQTSTSAENTAPPAATTLNSATAPNSATQNPVALPVTRPLIGNIPGLYPSSAIITSGGAAPVPPPIVIPTPPPPQIRFAGSGPPSAPMLNPNVLASVASALLAVRQNQPNIGGKMPAISNMNISDTSNSQLRHMNVLGPRTQNFSTTSSAVRQTTGNSFSQGQDQGGDSPLSPNSSDGDDLFEPPSERSQSDVAANGAGKVNKNGQYFVNASAAGHNSNDPFGSANKTKERSNIFDTLFGVGQDPGKKAAPMKPEKILKGKGKHIKKGVKKETIKVNTSGGLTEGELRLTDEVPTSAVELIVKQKYLKKLNRQERVVEEVKLSLKPYYSKRQVNKDEYKEILRRAVPKICHNKTGEINPGKIKELVEAYVKKFRHARKRGVDISNIN